MASGVPGRLHDRGAPRGRRTAAAAGRAVGNDSGDLAARPPWLPGRLAAGGGVQRPTVLARARSPRRRPPAGRRAGPGGSAGVDDPAGKEGKRPRAHFLWRSGGRAARRRLRETAGFHAPRGPGRRAVRVGASEGDRLLLHAALADRSPRPPDARAARARSLPRRHPLPPHRRSGDGQRRIPGGRVPLSRQRLRGGTDSRGYGLGRRPVGRRIGPASGARSPSGACTESIATRWPCNWAGYRCGWRPWPRIGR